ncbi:uncharacterized protein J4E88_002250 [Alternaria novae-zelandiae]|uniref:uncharacterized protein n=1 Tax=Alternaria novae-zelandiae TaxID=430562 RepID=UPI0020C25944|nr:uncharacterized protein J4E88_002250 [Alternaria novae-zelandiae]KAI4690777.1 hypothetical protein J4E88_002250 [Alternaria novae-zelandiae]
MNSSNVIILLSATFPALAISSFLFSLATYFRTPEAHPETQDRVDNLEDLEDIVPSLVEEVRALRRMVDRERQRTRRLENEVRDLGRRQQECEEIADEAGDEAEMEDDGDREVQKRQEGETPVRKPFDVDEFLEEQRARELACRMIQRSMINRTRCSGVYPNDSILDEPLHVSEVYGIRGGEVTSLDDEEALEAAAASALPPSPEEGSTSSRDEPRTLTQAVRTGGNVETRARMLVEEDMPTLLTNDDSATPTTNGHPQIPHLDTTNYDIITITTSPIRQRLNNLYPSPRGPRPTRIVIRNDPGGLWRRTILTDVLTGITPQLGLRTMRTIIEEYERSFLDNASRREATTNGHVRHVAPRDGWYEIEPTRLTTNMPSGERHAHQPNGYTNGYTHTPSTNGNIQYPSLPNGHVNNHLPSNDNRFYGYIYEPTNDGSNEEDYADAREIIRPLLVVLYGLRPSIGSRVIRDIMVRYTIAMGLGYTDPNNHRRTLLTTAAVHLEAVNGFVDHEGVEDLSEDVWIREPNSEYHNGDSRGSGRSTNYNRNGTTNTFHINAGIVTPNNTSANGAPLRNGRTHTSNAYTQTPSPERVTADPDDIRPRPRLSTSELNEAIGDWGSVSYTLDGPILRLRAIRAEGGIDQELHLRPHQATEARTNGYATAIQIIPPSVYVGNGTRSSSESSTRSSRSASLSGTTLVNSAVGSTNGDTVPTSNPPTNGELSESVELHRNGAYETPTATLRRRRDARDVRRAARDNLLVERGVVEEESAGSSEGGSEDSMDAEIAEVEEMWREIRRQRGTMEEEMMRHVAARERAAQVQQTNGAGTNGVESEGGDEASEGSGSEARERRLDGE